MAMRDFTLPGDDLGYVMSPEYTQAAEPLADVLRKSIGRPGTSPLLAAIVRTAISLEMPTAFPPIDCRDNKLREMTTAAPAAGRAAFLEDRWSALNGLS
jgi:hypothetical protein